jgi:hypothetical protein
MARVGSQSYALPARLAVPARGAASGSNEESPRDCPSADGGRKLLFQRAHWSGTTPGRVQRFSLDRQ